MSFMHSIYHEDSTPGDDVRSCLRQAYRLRETATTSDAMADALDRLSKRLDDRKAKRDAA